MHIISYEILALIFAWLPRSPQIANAFHRFGCLNSHAVATSSFKSKLWRNPSIFLHFFNLCHTSLTFNSLEKKAFFENIAGKGENAGKQHFLLFPKYFIPFPKQISIRKSHLFCHLQMPSISTSLKFCPLVKSLYW